jgi:hypothetical protein
MRALALTEEMLADATSERGHYLEPAWRETRGYIRLARGDSSGAEEDSRLAVERARVAGDAQILVPTVALRAFVVAGDRPHLAAELLEELQRLTGRTWSRLPTFWYPPVVRVALALGRSELAQAIADASPGSTPWLEGGLLLLQGDPEGAAERFAAFGARPDEAQARLTAAKTLVEAGRAPEADAQPAGALAFFREVGATGYAREAEALLRASA